MNQTTAGAPARPGLVCAMLATALIATSLTLVDALARPQSFGGPTEGARSGHGGAAEAGGAAQALGRALGARAARPLGGDPFVRTVPGARSDIALFIEPRSAGELKGALERANFELDEVRGGGAEVPRVYVAALPPDLPEVGQVETRKRLFLRSVLPLVLLANEEIAQRRARMLELVGRLEAGEEIPIADRAWLDALAELYEVEHGDFASLGARVAEIPPSLALAQAIVESGWGTSRFALQGNALFGQRVWSAEAAALVPEENRGVRVQAFLDLMQSVRSYMHNLNTHPAYRGLRAERARLAAAGQRPDGARLAAGLESYAEIDGYVAKLETLMRHNSLAELDDARLQSRPFTAFNPPRR